VELELCETGTGTGANWNWNLSRTGTLNSTRGARNSELELIENWNWNSSELELLSENSEFWNSALNSELGTRSSELGTGTQRGTGTRNSELELIRTGTQRTAPTCKAVLLYIPVTNSSTEGGLAVHVSGTGFFPKLPALAVYWPSPFAPLCPQATAVLQLHICAPLSPTGISPLPAPLWPRWSLSHSAAFRPLPLELHWPFIFLMYWPSPFAPLAFPLSPCFISRSGGTGLALSPSSASPL
jgi:hypothetical protein